MDDDDDDDDAIEGMRQQYDIFHNRYYYVKPAELTRRKTKSEKVFTTFLKPCVAMQSCVMAVFIRH